MSRNPLTPFALILASGASAYAECPGWHSPD